MIEESFVRLYASDFVRMAQRPEHMAPDDLALERRIGEARKHADVMDARKGEGHLAALISRLKDEARRPPSGIHSVSADDTGAIAKRHRFLAEVASRLGATEDRPPSPEMRVASERIADGRITYDGVVVGILDGGHRSIRLDNGHIVSAAPSENSEAKGVPGDRMSIEITIHQSKGWLMAGPSRVC